MPINDRWLSPRDAASEISRRAGYLITPDDLKQMRRRGKIKKARQVTGNLYVYDRKEIDTVIPPKKHNPVPISTNVENS